MHDLRNSVPNVRLFTFGGIPIHVDITFALVVVQVVVSLGGRNLGLVASVKLAVVLIGGVLGSILLHELGHAAVAHRYRLRTHYIWIGCGYGLAIHDAAYSERQTVAILLAGPLANALVALWLWALLGFPDLFGAIRFVGAGVRAVPWSDVPLYYAVRSLALLNIAMVVINLLPAFPLDGGRAQRIWLRHWIGEVRAVKVIAGLGTLVGIWCCLAAARYGLGWLVIGVVLLVMNPMIFRDPRQVPQE